MAEHEHIPGARRVRVVERHVSRGPGFGSVFLGLLLIALGIGYLGSTFGWWSFAHPSAWWQFWPVLLIALGLALFSDRGTGASLVAGILTALIIAFVVLALMGKGPAPFRTYETREYRYVQPGGTIYMNP